MIEAVTGCDEEVADFVAQRTGATRGFGPCVGIAWMEGLTMVAGTVYHNFYREAGVIELSSAADHPRWLTRKSLQFMFGYPFDQLGCQLVVLRMSERNERMRGIAQRFGFSETIIPRLRGRDEAEVVCCLTVEQWREKEKELGKERRAGTSRSDQDG